jgi:hypothetical protein
MSDASNCSQRAKAIFSGARPETQERPPESDRSHDSEPATGYQSDGIIFE